MEEDGDDILNDTYIAQDVEDQKSATKILEIEDANIDPADDDIVDENVDDAALVNAVPCTQIGPFFQGGFRVEIWPSIDEWGKSSLMFHWRICRSMSAACSMGEQRTPSGAWTVNYCTKSLSLQFEPVSQHIGDFLTNL